MINPRDLVDSFRRIPLVGEARDLIKKMTSYHRIQGSIGLINAVKEVYEALGDTGLDLKIFEIPSSSGKRFMETPISWDIEDAYLEVKINGKKVSRFEHRDHPTLVSAHSPPGEGCGEVYFCKDLSNCRGEVVLIEAPAYVAYREISARLIILYDSKRYPDGVPYTGLFIRENEIKNTSVVNIPYNTALKIISSLSKGAVVEACWEIRSRYSSRPLYGLIASSGGDPGILYISHICHPKPGAHDNASGVVSNILIARLTAKTNTPRSRVHLFVPEYTGTIYTGKLLPWKPLVAVNLDMVGSKQSITNSTLNIVNQPLFIESISLIYLLLATKYILDEASSFGGFRLPAYRYSMTPYTAGSDHDVTVLWGLDSVMLNEWPSRYYHTDMDDIETISPIQIVNAVYIATLAGYMALVNWKRDDLISMYRDYLKSWYSIEALRDGVDISMLSKILENRVTIPYDHERTPISSRYIYGKIGALNYLKLRNIKGAFTYLSVYAPLAYYIDLRNSIEVFQLENLLQWSRGERELVEETWGLIRGDLM